MDWRIVRGAERARRSRLVDDAGLARCHAPP